MAILTKGAARSAHWYTRDGLPMHTVVKADGVGERATTLRDARKLELLPSVTGILQVMAKPSLEDWKMQQVALAALRTVKQESESVEYWVRRVIDASQEQVEVAADLGSEIHAALEAATAGEPWDIERYGVYVRPVLGFIGTEGILVNAREKCLVNPEHGFAGTTDVLFTRAEGCLGILDYKTKKTKPGEKVEAYDEHRLQLAAYAATEYGEARIGEVTAFNVFVSSTEPGRVEIVRHGDLTRDWQAFKLMASVWRYSKNYDPRFNPAA